MARSEVVRTASGGSPVSHTGLHFLSMDPDTEKRLREIIFDFVQTVLQAQRSNASGSSSRGDVILMSLGSALRARSPGYVTYRLTEGSWAREHNDTPQQPPDGFTVAAWEDEEERALLCEVYGAAEPEQRVLIRLLAELSTRSGRMVG